jgi:hypothetical protein
MMLEEIIPGNGGQGSQDNAFSLSADVHRACLETVLFGDPHRLRSTGFKDFRGFHRNLPLLEGDIPKEYIIRSEYQAMIERGRIPFFSPPGLNNSFCWPL